MLGEPHRGKAVGAASQQGDDHVDEGDPVGEVGPGGGEGRVEQGTVRGVPKALVKSFIQRRRP